jgi:hypothetical protein
MPVHSIDPACEMFFRDFVQTHGRAPGRNQMVRLMADTAVPPKRVEKSWRQLMGKEPTRPPSNHVRNGRVDPEALARELGALAAWETVAAAE